MDSRRPAWSAEAVLERPGWRERHRPDAGVDAPAVLELDPEVPLGRRLRRAVSAPVVAGGAVFLAAVVTAITVTLLQGPGALEAAGALGGAVAGAADAAGAEAVDGSTPGQGEPTGAGGGAATPGAVAQSGTVFVHVVGEVDEPGIVELPAGSRVADALEAAGGTTAGAVLERLNLARVVVDGEQVVIPDAAAAVAASAGSGTAAAGAASGAGSAGGGSSTVGDTEDAAVELNSADRAALETLPGVGPALAQRIIDRREQNGPFTAVDQLLDVRGIGPKVFAGLRDRVVLR